MIIKDFFDEATFTVTYVVYDESTKDTIVIDPVLDFDPASGAVSFESMNQIIDFINGKSLNVGMILETHAHADHLSSSHYLKEVFPNAVVAIGENIKVVQETFKPIFDKGEEFSVDGSQFDKLLKDDETVKVGSLEFKVIFTPGHTPACSSYYFDGAVFTGDTIFMPDSGTGRCDFPAGSAEDLFHSIHDRLYSLPDETKVYVGHDYQPGGRGIEFQTTIADQKSGNIQLTSETSKDDFVKKRKARDQTLRAPKLLLPSVQVNMDAGRLPKAPESDVPFLKIPVTLKKVD